MIRQSIDLALQIARLEHLSHEALREEWRRLNQAPPPKRLSQDILLRALTYKLQEAALGGLSKSIIRSLQLSDRDGTSAAARRRPRPSLKPGTRLVREWRGVTHMAVILTDGVEWRGGRYPSLSALAREITGAHWSGPRFFGLERRD